MIHGAAALGALLVEFDLADAIEDFDLDPLLHETREKAADGVPLFSHGRFGA
jgi:hypothetical protein